MAYVEYANGDTKVCVNECVCAIAYVKCEECASCARVKM